MPADSGAMRARVRTQDRANFLGRFAGAADLWIALVLAAWAWRQFSVAARSLTPPVVNLLDHSWVLDFSAKAREGIWLGRDVVFTYGPLAQWLWAHVHLGASSLGARINGENFFPCLYSIAGAFAAAHLLVAGAAAWKRAIWLLAAVLIWNAFDLKVTTSLTVFALVLWLTRALPAETGKAASRGAVAALACTAAFLISYDSGAYSLLGVAIALILRALLVRSELRRLAIFAAAFSAAALLSVLAINVWSGGILNFRYWQMAATVVSDYRWVLPLGMVPEISRAFAVELAASLIFWILAARVMRQPEQKAEFYAALVFSVLMLQSGIVRSDFIHVAIGMIPMMLLPLALSLRGNESGARALLPAMCALAVAVFVGIGWGNLEPERGFWFAPATSTTSCGESMAEYDGACMPGDATGRLRSATKFLSEETTAAEPVAVFSYQNIYGYEARRTVAGGVLQNYLAVSGRLQQQQIAGYERQRPDLALYTVDGVGEPSVEASAAGRTASLSFSRSPQVWFYLQQHYRAEQQLAPGFWALRRDDARASRWQLQTRQLGGAVDFDVRAGHPFVVSGLHAANREDFLRIRMRAEYPLWWRLTKPAAAELWLQLTNGSVEVVPVVVPPNQDYDLWISAAPGAELAKYFAASANDWTTDAPQIQALAFNFRPMDWLSAWPSRVHIERIDAVRARLNSSLTAR